MDFLHSFNESCTRLRSQLLYVTVQNVSCDSGDFRNDMDASQDMIEDGEASFCTGAGVAILNGWQV